MTLWQVRMVGIIGRGMRHPEPVPLGRANAADADAAAQRESRLVRLEHVSTRGRIRGRRGRYGNPV